MCTRLASNTYAFQVLGLKVFAIIHCLEKPVLTSKYLEARREGVCEDSSLFILCKIGEKPSALRSRVGQDSRVNKVEGATEARRRVHVRFPVLRPWKASA